MEKFSVWTDKGTGINPFVPNRNNQFSSSVVAKTLSFTAGLVLLPLRLLLVLVLSLILILISTLDQLLPIWFLRRLLRTTLVKGLCRAILSVLGFFVIEERVPDCRRIGLGKLPPRVTLKPSPIRSGDILVCNHTSFIDVLFLAYRFGPDFGATSALKESGDKVKKTGLLWALYRSFSDPTALTNLRPAECTLDFEKAARLASSQSGAPLAVFPEGVRTNGKGLLKFHPAFARLNQVAIKGESIKVHLLAFKYGDADCAHPVGSGLVHLFKLCFSVSHSLQVSRVPCDLLREAAKNGKSLDVRTVLAQSVGARGVGLLEMEAHHALDFYQKWLGGGSSAKSKQT